MDRITIAAWILSADTPLDKRGAVYRALYSQANVDDFRGPGEPDSGTAFEIGFAVALGKEVWGYTTDTGTLADRVPATPSPHGQLCQRGFLVEDFGLSKNLMIACSARIVEGGPDSCIAEMSKAFQGSPSPYRQGGES